MKNIFFNTLLCAAALMLGISCSKNAETGKIEPQLEDCSVSADVLGADTKVALSGNTPQWQSGDKILVFGTDGKLIGSDGLFTLETGAGSNSGTFKGTKYFGQTPAYAIYPASVYDKATGKFTLPTAQDGTVTTAFKSYAVMMGAIDGSQHIDFKNVCSIVKLNTGDYGKSGGEAAIKSVKLSAATSAITGDFTPNWTGTPSISPADEGTSQEVTVTAANAETGYAANTDIYIPVFPVASQSISIKFANTGGKVATVSETFAPAVNKIKDLGIAGGMEFKTPEPKPNEIWYWTSNEQPIIVWSDKYNSWQWTRNGGEISDYQYDVNPVSKFGSDIVSSTYTPGGKGVIKFAAPITKIGNYGFSNIWGSGSEKITKIVFPEGLIELESSIFTMWGGEYGGEIVIPRSVTTIVPKSGGTFYYSFCPVTVGYVDGITYSRDTHPSPGPMSPDPDPYGNWAFYLTLGNGVTYEVWSCCFAKGTLITLADGSQKKVEDLTYSDKLKVWNFDDGKDDSANILWITKAGLKASYFFRCTLSDGTVLDLIGEEDEGTHRLFNKTAGKFEYPDQMAPGSKVYTEHGLVEVVSFERIDEEVEYYNLITDKDINCYANEVLTSCRYNNIYPIDQDMKFIKDGRKIRPYKEFKKAGISREWYVGMRLGEQTYDVEDVASYIGRCESQMAEKPAPTFWQKIKTWWKSIFG